MQDTQRGQIFGFDGRNKAASLGSCVMSQLSRHGHENDFTSRESDSPAPETQVIGCGER
jgi:hypothetical protein